MILPVFALSLYQVGFIARLTRGSMIEVLRTQLCPHGARQGPARARSPSRATPSRPALLPVVSYLGPAIVNTITGSVIIEQIFGIPGIGRYFVQAALNRDYTLVMGVTVFYGVLIILVNLAVDLIYGLLDPRSPLRLRRHDGHRLPAQHLARRGDQGPQPVGDAWRRLLQQQGRGGQHRAAAHHHRWPRSSAPCLSPFAYDDVSWDSISIPPDFASGHYFGTDDNGRDLFVRTLYGGRISLTVGIVATLVSLVIGVAWGATAGFIGGRVDGVMMRIVDILYSAALHLLRHHADRGLRPRTSC